MDTTVAQRTSTDRVTWRSVAVLAPLLVVPGLVYVVTVLRPYDHGGGQLLVGYAALLLAPLGALLALGGAVLQLLAVSSSDRRTVTPAAAGALAVLALCALAVVVWFASPAGTAVTTWQLD
ncbi:hypothetical protein [Modestobacter versicolor]|uniref:hypothetical protein n=1 Tax=Modestobacter versicolor TaxID=429133 RepID=UPI0034DEDF6F